MRIKWGNACNAFPSISGAQLFSAVGVVVIFTLCSLIGIWCSVFVTPWAAARQASLSFTLSHSLLILMSLSRWCHPAISSSVVPSSSCPWFFPASGSFPVSQLFTSGGQSIGASASAPVLPMNIQGWFPLGLTGLISLACWFILLCCNYISYFFFKRNFLIVNIKQKKV